MENNYNNRKIDVIIPAYNVPDNILFRCLSSIASQDIISDIKITIVDDASTIQNYQKVADNFKDFLKINILRYENNGGPGVARQYGMDRSYNEYITFIDADDTFITSYALRILRNAIETNNKQYNIAIASFHESFENDENVFFTSHIRDLTWVFAKIYRRSFIDKYNIHFHESSRSNEDNGFNTLARLCSGNENINYIDDVLYCWHDTPNSITRINEYEYAYGCSTKDSFYGYVENTIFAIKESSKHIPNSSLVAISCSAMIYIYLLYIECCHKSEYADKNLKWCKMYYEEIYKNMEDYITEDIFYTEYNNHIKKKYSNDSFYGIVPHITFFEFIDMLRNYKEE